MLIFPYGYDCETYPNTFTFIARQVVTGHKVVFEISDRRNDIEGLMSFVRYCAENGIAWFGYNNISFDYPVMHFIIQNQKTITVGDIYAKAMAIINTPFNQRFSNNVRVSDHHVRQIDLFLIRHFDNVSRSTSLKALEFNMKMDTIEDLPFPVGTMLDHDSKDILISYNGHDVDATVDFYWETVEMILFRDELTAKYDKDFTNFNDTKIGKQFFIMKLEENGVGCYDFVDGKRTARQTKRDVIHLCDVIPAYVRFERPEFQRVLEWIRSQNIKETKGVFEDVNATLDGFQYDFGTGGIHGSVDSQIVDSDDQWIIEDWDVASYYPNLAIKNNFYPEHLSTEFCRIYQDIYDQRVLAKKNKKSALERGDQDDADKWECVQAMLKLALNGVYGDSNSKFSPLYDPAFTMSITITGQLLLCMLAEQLIKTPSLTMIQINTDGLTVRYPRIHKDYVHAVCKWWEELTQLTLEDVEYDRMFVKNVNNYIGLYPGGKVKRKGIYAHQSDPKAKDRDLDWHQDHSAMVVAKAAEAELLSDGAITARDFIENHRNIYDFLLRAKVPRTSRLITVDYEGVEHQEQNVVRYHISTFGRDLIKLMPPLPKKVEMGVTEWRRFNQQKGWKVTVCNNIKDANIDDIDHQWYIDAARKLIDPLRRV